MRLFAVLAFLLSFTGTATASDIFYWPERCDRSGCLGGISFSGASGERNVVTVDVGAESAIVRDEGAPLTVRDGCERLDTHTARCPARDGVMVRTGDGDDILRSASRRIGFELGPGNDDFAGAGWGTGGEGDDRLLGSASNDDLAGGDGADTIMGGPGPDLLSGNAGVDVLDGGDDGDLIAADDGFDGRAEGDLVDGGPGVDTVAWGSMTRTGVIVDLADDEPDGVPGAPETLTAIENVGGTSSADRIAGDDGANRLTGGGGRDVLVGRGGNDRLWLSQPPARDAPRPSCGGGDDRLVVDSLLPLIPIGCEVVGLLDNRYSVRVLRQVKRHVIVHASCRFECRSTLILRTRSGPRWRSSRRLRPAQFMRQTFRFGLPERVRVSGRIVELEIRVLPRWGRGQAFRMDVSL